MLRLLVVAAVVGLAFWYFMGGTGKHGEPARPEVQYEQQKERVDSMEQQLQQQTQQQLQTLDAEATPPPVED